MDLLTVKIEKPEAANFILGQSHFIKTVEDIHEAIVAANSQMRFGLAFCESSGPALVRRSGNDETLTELATRNALAVGAGHSFFVFMENGFPINILNAIKAVPEVCRIFCATANPVEVVVAESAQGRAILGVVEGCRG
jgi:adenosine/AMP kinase